MKKLLALSFSSLAAVAAFADTTPFALSSGNFVQDWSNTSMITTNDNWSGVGSIMGFRGDNLTALTGVDPQTVLADDTPGVVNVIANQANPNTVTSGGVAEFENNALSNPMVAFQGSGTADAPYLQFYFDSTGRQDVTISYKLIDIDGSTDNSVQPVALQYRLGNTGTWTNVASAFVADASAGPSATGQTTLVSATDVSWTNAAVLQFRVMTTNAVGSDEWIGVDDISVQSNPVPEPATFLALGMGCALLKRRRK